MYPKETVENYRVNVEKYDWARTQLDAVKTAADSWVNKSDEELWSMIPGQELPRTIDVTWDYDFPEKARLGCLKCGDAIHNHGNYPYNPDFENKPWKLTCPNCGVVFPTNDFGKYYASGIDEHGLFNPAKADKSLLFNTEHPDPADPLHKYGVDDGYGYVDGNGREHKFIAYYAWKYWRNIVSGVQKLSDAYLYTGDKVYARKAAVMLDRIADVYPDMDWNPYAKRGWYHSDGSSKQGKIEGRIWETGTMQQFSRAYDKIISGTVDNPELYAFLKQKSQQFQLPGNKGTREDLIGNIDKGILKTTAEALMSGRIRGNEGMHQSSMACAALALNTEPETSKWLDWIFAEDGGHIPKLMIELFDRDGMSDEAAPHYCYLWPAKIVEIMNFLEPYKAYRKNVISRDFPYFKNALIAPWRVQLLNTFTPNIGDTGSTGKILLGINPGIIAAAFEFYHDTKAANYALQCLKQGRLQAAEDSKTTALVAGSTPPVTASDLLIDLGSTDPEAMWKSLKEVAANYNEAPHYGENMAGYGLASFEFGNDASGKSLWMYYGRNTGHGHEDRLNYGIYAFNTDLTPDLGYPEFANYIWPQGPAWNNNTISHNTVIVDQRRQDHSWTGYPNFYASGPGFGVVEVDSPNAYSGLKQYQRTMAFIEAPGSKDAYAVDVFRVNGGSDHLLGFHGPPGAVTPADITFTRQTTGTYAGENVPFESMDKGHAYGYSFLKNVERADSPAKPFTLDWKAETGYRGVKASDDLHIRMHMLNTDLNDVALADGIPPQNKPGNPKSLRYALMHRKSDNKNLKSCFVSVVEPWIDKSFITKTTRLSTGEDVENNVEIIKVEFGPDSADYIISNPERKNVITENNISTDGVFAWIRRIDGKVASYSLTRGTELKADGFAVTGAGDVAGELVRFEKDPKKPAYAWVKLTAGNPDAMKGAQIIFDNDRQRNACYDIKSIDQDGDLVKIECGPGNFARGFVDDKDYSKGYVYNVKEGAKFYVPVTISSGGKKQ